MEKKADRAFLTLENATLRIGEASLFPNTNWEFRSDHHWAFLGENGSGKTILAGALWGAIQLSKGTIYYHFKVPKGEMPEDSIEHVSFDGQRRIAEVHSSYLQSRYNSIGDGQEMTVSEFLEQDQVEEINPFEVMKQDRSTSAFQRRRQQAIRLLEIRSLMQYKMPQLSNGELRKIILARALLRTPRLLILDDPFVGLDYRYRCHFKRIIEQLIQKGMRILLITSRRDEILASITHIAFIQKHRIAAMGPKSELLHTRRVTTLFGKVHPRLPKDLPINKKPRYPLKTNAPIVAIKRLNISYDNTYILKNISWTINTAERWALIGPNGSGKSTLLSVIYGDNPQAYANDVTVLGKKRSAGYSIWELRKHLGYISPELHQHYDESASCFEVVCSGFCDSNGLFRTIPLQKRVTAARWMEVLELTRYASDPFGSLSTGLQRMVLLTRALVKSPALLLLDEPCQGLDARLRSLFNGVIESIGRKTDTTIIYVTHHFSDIPNTINLIARMKDGRIIRFEKRKISTRIKLR